MRRLVDTCFTCEVEVSDIDPVYRFRCRSSVWLCWFPSHLENVEDSSLRCCCGPMMVCDIRTSPVILKINVIPPRIQHRCAYHLLRAWEHAHTPLVFYGLGSFKASKNQHSRCWCAHVTPMCQKIDFSGQLWLLLFLT
ncbi:unnamed protein product [Ectocarpus sp. 12 AP-2014]